MSDQKPNPTPHAAPPQMFLNLAVKDLARSIKFLLIWAIILIPNLPAHRVPAWF